MKKPTEIRNDTIISDNYTIGSTDEILIKHLFARKNKKENASWDGKTVFMSHVDPAYIKDAMQEYGLIKYQEGWKHSHAVDSTTISLHNETIIGEKDLQGGKKTYKDDNESPESSVWPGEDFENAIYHIIEHFVNNDRQEDCVNRLLVAFKQLQSRTAVKAEQGQDGERLAYYRDIFKLDMAALNRYRVRLLAGMDKIEAEERAKLKP